MHKYRGLVLRQVPYREHRYMLYLWTRDAGPLSFAVYASRSTQGILRAGQLRPLQELELVTAGASSSSVQRVREMYPVPTVIGDLRGLQLVAYALMAEWLASVLAEGLNESAYYDEFSARLVDGYQRSDTLAVVAECLAGLSRHLGFAPDPQQYRSGFLLNGQSGSWMRPDAGNLETPWHMSAGSSALYAEALEGQLRSERYGVEFLNELATYFQVHLTGFRRPRYLALLLTS